MINNGDHPVYVFIALLKTENPNKYCGIVPFLGPFHTMCDDERYIQALRGEWARGMAEGSVECALQGKHYKRGLLCLWLVYEALVNQLVKWKPTPDLADETRRTFRLWEIRVSPKNPALLTTRHRRRMLTSRASSPTYSPRRRPVSWRTTEGTFCPWRTRWCRICT